jgi:hypothetical protein
VLAKINDPASLRDANLLACTDMAYHAIFDDHDRRAGWGGDAGGGYKCGLSHWGEL